jgi:5-formyltetrahydrofolate cyclo-ligase
MTAKAHLRSKMSARLRPLSSKQILEWGRKIQKRIIDAPIFERSKTLAIYAPFQNEVRTDDLFDQARKGGKKVAFPRVAEEKRRLVFCWVDAWEDLVSSPLGPLAPRSGLPEVPYDALELMVIPGLAFDFQGYRLGRGKGFYDKTLEGFSGVRLGIAYGFQVVQRLPRSQWDEPMQWVATEDNLYKVPFSMMTS